MFIRKRAFLVVCLLMLAVGVFAQQTTVNPSQINPSQIDFSKVDLSGVHFYFQGPAQFYVTGLRYNGMVYSAVLDYDGKGTFSVKVPDQVTTAGKPLSIDLSGITLKLASNGVQLNDIGINGNAYTGTLSVTPQNNLVISNYSETGSLAAAAPSADLASLRSQVAALQSQLASVTSESKQKDQTIAGLRDQLASMPTGGAPVPSASDYPNVIVNGFAGGNGALGTWVVANNTLQQQNAGMHFAKYTANVPQQNLQYFYQFSGSATGSGWRGYGVHFLASGSKSADGYGYGSSYLVWVTRDPSNLQTGGTFVQLYRSYDDVHMVQVASKEIPGSIDQENTIGVAVDRAANTITVLANGNEIFRYRSVDNINSGNGIALRALGTVTFTQAQIRTK